ncbi:MAG TPA: ABC transporter substrate-binding protein [Cellulomonas sp.]
MSLSPLRAVRASAAAACAVALLALAGCSSEPAAQETTATDQSTRTVDSYYGDVEVPADPQNIVAVSYDTPWQLMSLGVDVIGAQDYSSYASSFTEEQDEYLADASSVGTYGEIDYEAVLALAPDLIVGDAYEVDEDVYAKLSAIAPTVIVFGDDRADWKTIVDDLAAAVGAEDTLDEVSAAYDARIAELQDEYAEVLAGYTVAPVTIGNQEVEFSIMYPTGVTGSIYTELGFTYADSIPEGDFEAGYESYPYERISEILGDADVIVTPTQADGTNYPALQTLFDNELFQALPAAVAGHVYSFPLDVTDYVTALDYLDSIEQNVLSVLAR